MTTSPRISFTQSVGSNHFIPIDILEAQQPEDKALPILHRTVSNAATPSHFSLAERTITTNSRPEDTRTEVQSLDLDNSLFLTNLSAWNFSEIAALFAQSLQSKEEDFQASGIFIRPELLRF